MNKNYNKNDYDYNSYNDNEDYIDEEQSEADYDKELLAINLLLKSIQQNRISGISSFIQQGYDIHFNKEEAFLHAINHSNLKTIQYLIECGVDFRIEEHLALRKALSQKDFKLAQLLIDNGDSFKTFEHHLARSSIEDYNNFITLDFMLYNGYRLNDAHPFLSLFDLSEPIKTINALVERGLNIHSNNNCFLENSISCMPSEQEDAFSYLLQNFEYSLEEKNEALKFALDEGYFNKAFKLLDFGADVTYDNSLFLKKMTHKGDLELVKKVISYGQSCHHQNSLLNCVKYKKLDCFIYLIENGNFTSIDKKEAFKFSLDTGNLSICSYLLKNEQNNEYQHYYLSTLNLAIEEIDIPLALLLIKEREMILSDADLLYNCIFAGSPSLPIWNALIEKEVNIFIPDIIASIISRDQLDFFKTLIQSGFDIHEQDDKAFILSCERKSKNITQHLIELGANVNANKGQCILNYIYTYNYSPDIVDLFFRHGFILPDNLLNDYHMIKDEAKTYVLDISNKINFVNELEKKLEQSDLSTKKLKL